MAATTINKKVKFKTTETIKVYASAKSTAKTSNKKVDTKTEYTATKLDGSFYYIKEFKKWVKKSLVSEVTSKKNTTASGTSLKYKFKEVGKYVYGYKTDTATKSNVTIKTTSKSYTVTKVSSNKRLYVKELNTWVPTSSMQLVLSTVKEDTIENKQKQEKEKINQENAMNKILNDLVTIKTDTGTTVTGGSNSADADLDVKSLVGIWGAPYQSNKYVDPKLSNTTFGAYYGDRVMSRMPLLVLSPGKVAFMKNNNDNDKEEIKNLISWASSGSDTALSAYLGKPGKYYTFEYDNDTFWQYVNTFNMASAVFLGIGDVEIEYNGYKEKIKNYKWEKATNVAFGNAVQSSDNFITFFADSETSAGESFQNNTSESMIAGNLNKSSELGREIRFLIGENGKLGSVVNQNTIDTALAAIDSLASAVLGDNELVSQLGKEFAVIASGGKLIFPELWSDSSFTTDFDVKFKLRCPCPNKVSWFLDICVPMNILRALAMPRTPHGADIAGELFNDDITANGYFSPFLVRGFYKGVATVDLGIVASLQFDKGKEGSWTVDGLPTEVDVSMTIKDLYNTMAMTAKETGNGTALINNSQFLSYLAFNCGISINEPDIVKSVLLWGTIYSTTIYNNVKDKITLYRFWRKFSNGVSNKFYDLSAGLLRR